MPRALFLYLFLLISVSSVRIEAAPWKSSSGIGQSVEEIMRREKSGAVTQRLRKTRPEAEAEPENVLPRPNKSVRKIQPAAPAQTQAALTVGTSFDAAVYADSSTVPPDSMGDIGPTQFLLCLNGRIRTFTRDGLADGALNTTTANFFDAVRGDGDTADPRVRYDKLSGRWFITMLAYETPTRVVIAVSSGPVITPSTTFTFFQFGHWEVGPQPNSDTGSFFDFDTLGVDRHALYIGGNVFNPSVHPPSYVGSTGFVVNKADLTTGVLSVTAFRQIGNPSSGGLFAPQGVDNNDRNSSEGYFIGRDLASNDHLIIRRISNPGGAPSISANIAVNIPPTAQPKGGVLAQGSSFPLADLDDRLGQARLHNGHLITAHNIEVDSNGAASAGGGRDAVRWYDIVNLATSPVLSQSGTLFDPAASAAKSYWMPAAARSGQGHLAVASNVAATNMFPQVAAAFRWASDPPGSLGAPTVVQPASANCNDLVDRFNQHRWGDYSVLSLDPNDDMTFWAAQEYSNASDSWAVRVIQLQPPPPATPAAAAPSALARGQFDTDVVITGAIESGSGFFDPGATFPNRLSAAVNGGGITVNRVTFIDPTHGTLNLTVASGASLGTRTVTLTNPDGQSATSAAGLITINPASDTDGDSLPDWWMNKYFGHTTGQAADRSRANDDADGDGMTNSQEFRAHTEPRNAASVFRITNAQRSGNTVQVTFASVPGKLYRLEAKTWLSEPTWNIVSNNINGLDGATTAVDPNGVLPRFYRVTALD